VYDKLLYDLGKILVEEEVIKSADIFTKWKECPLTEKETLDKKWNKILREIRNTLCAFILTTILSPSIPLLHNSASHYIEYIQFIYSGSDIDFVPVLGMKSYTTWMSFGKHSDEADDRVDGWRGPMTQIVEYVHKFKTEFDFITVHDYVSNVASVRIAKAKLPQQNELGWLSAAIHMLTFVVIPALTELENCDERIANDLVARIGIMRDELLCNHELMLYLIGFIMPIDRKEKSCLPVQLSHTYALITPFSHNNAYQMTPRQHFLYENRFEYLTWFHVVSIIWYEYIINVINKQLVCICRFVLRYLFIVLYQLQKGSALLNITRN
jgi:hypothetical protein